MNYTPFSGPPETKADVKMLLKEPWGFQLHSSKLQLSYCQPHQKSRISETTNQKIIGKKSHSSKQQFKTIHFAGKVITWYEENHRKQSFKKWRRTSLAEKWLRLRASTAGSTGSIPGWGTKISHASRRGHNKNQKTKWKELLFFWLGRLKMTNLAILSKGKSNLMQLQ